MEGIDEGDRPRYFCRDEMAAEDAAEEFHRGHLIPKSRLLIFAMRPSG